MTEGEFNNLPSQRMKAMKEEITCLRAKLHHYKHEVVETALTNEKDAADRIEVLEAEKNEALNQLDSARHSIEVLEAHIKRLTTFSYRMFNIAKECLRENAELQQKLKEQSE